MPPFTTICLHKLDNLCSFYRKRFILLRSRSLIKHCHAIKMFSNVVQSYSCCFSYGFQPRSTLKIFYLHVQPDLEWHFLWDKIFSDRRVLEHVLTLFGRDPHYRTCGAPQRTPLWPGPPSCWIQGWRRACLKRLAAKLRKNRKKDWTVVS